MMKFTLYGIPNCDTVKKARVWLTEHDCDVIFYDVKKQGITPELVQSWLNYVSWETLINRKGTTWRKLPEADKIAVIDAASANHCMVNWPTIIKRPVIVVTTTTSTQVIVGFSPEHYQDAINACM